MPAAVPAAAARLSALARVTASGCRDRDRLVRARDARLVEVVRHTAAHSPWYRRLWQEAGCEPSSVRTAGDLAGFPLVSKTMVRADVEQILTPAARARGVRSAPTSGSTGEPLVVPHDPASAAVLDAVWARSHLAYGLRPHHRTAYFRNLPSSPTLTERLGIFRAEHLDIDAPDARLAARLRELRPHVLGGYPSHILELLDRLGPDRLSGLGIRWVTTGAETLTEDARREIADGVGARVVDLYGTIEFGCIAFECALGTRHLNDDAVLVEVLDDDGRPVPEGSPGELVVTGLYGAAMPFVRYRIGDRGTVDSRPCGCGRPLRRMTSLEGRGASAVLTTGGQRITGARLCAHLREIPTLRRYQVAQTSLTDLVVRIIPDPGTDQATAQAVREAVRRQFGSEVSIEIDLVERIERTAGGKVPDIIPMPS